MSMNMLLILTKFLRRESLYIFDKKRRCFWVHFYLTIQIDIPLHLYKKIVNQLQFYRSYNSFPNFRTRCSTYGLWSRLTRTITLTNDASGWSCMLKWMLLSKKKKKNQFNLGSIKKRKKKRFSINYTTAVLRSTYYKLQMADDRKKSAIKNILCLIIHHQNWLKLFIWWKKCTKRLKEQG